MMLSHTFYLGIITIQLLFVKYVIVQAMEERDRLSYYSYYIQNSKSGLELN